MRHQAERRLQLRCRACHCHLLSCRLRRIELPVSRLSYPGRLCCTARLSLHADSPRDRFALEKLLLVRLPQAAPRCRHAPGQPAVFPLRATIQRHLHMGAQKDRLGKGRELFDVHEGDGECLIAALRQMAHSRISPGRFAQRRDVLQRPVPQRRRPSHRGGDQVGEGAPWIAQLGSLLLEIRQPVLRARGSRAHPSLLDREARPRTPCMRRRIRARTLREGRTSSITRGTAKSISDTSALPSATAK